MIVAEDRFPDQIPEAATPVTIEEADGNHVILKLADGVYAFYAHLKPGSVTVQSGDTVTKDSRSGGPATPAAPPDRTCTSS